MRVRIGKDIKVKWAVLTDGSALPLNKGELTLELAGPNGKNQSMEFEVEGNVLTATFYGKDQNYTGDYMLTLWKNKGKEGQSVVDKTSAFSLVRYTPQEDLAQKHDNLSATLADLGDTSLVTIDGASETTLVCNLTGYKAVEDVSDLPMEPSTIGYLVGDNLYVYVGEGGDTLDGKYKNCGPFRGLKGDRGPQGNSGYRGEAGELEVVNNLTDGGETAALSAEQGKVLDSKKQDKLNYYAENDGRAVMQASYVGMLSSEDTNEGGKESTGLYASKGVASLYYAERDAENKVQHEDGLYLEKRRENGSGCVFLRSYNAGGANSKIQITPEKVSIKGAETVETAAPEVSVKATGGVKFETQGTDSTNAYIEMLGGDEPDLDLHTDSNLTIFGNNSVAIESDNNISVTANSNIDLSATDNISMSSSSGKIDDVVGALVSNANAIATLNGTGDGSVSKKVTDEIAKIVDSAPEAFDTLKEIADYITEDMSGAEEIVTSLGALNLRVYELGDFATAKDAEDKAREPLYSGSDNISIIHYTINRSTDGLILQHQDVDGGYHRSLQTLFYHSRLYVRFVWFTDSTRTVLLENANFNRDWWETSISHLEYDKTTHTIKCRRIGQDVNRAKWITLPIASTSTDGLMTMAQVKSLEGKQDALQTYEETTDKAEVKMPNGKSYVRVTKDGSGMYAQDGKSGIVNSSSGSRLVYMETATDASGSSYTSHRDDISIGKHDGNSATHITLTSRSTTEEAGEKITNTSTIQVNPDGIAMSSPNGEIKDIVKEISGKASSESVSELRQEVDDKAPKSGYAPDLKVNFAKELVGRGEATPEVIGGIRPTGEISIGDGNATIERIKGNSVVWNQRAKNHDLTNGLTNWYAGNGATLTLNDDGSIRVTLSGKDKYNTDIRQTVKPIAGHQYAYYVEVKGGVDGQSVNIKLGGNLSKIHTIYTSKKTISGIITGTSSDDLFRPCCLKDMIYDGQVGDYVDVYSAVLYDLTLMFGAGNEPTTIEDFEARKPLNVTDEYNEGTIVSYDGSALKSVGFNAYNGTYAKVIGGEEYHATGTTSISFAKELGGATTAITLDSENKFKPEEDGYVFAEGKDIVIHLTHSYTPDHVDEYEEDVHVLPDVKSILDADDNQLFPNGLLSAGSVHDEITATKAVKRVGVVDMGTLNWERYKYSEGFYYFRHSSNDVANGTYGKSANLVCAQYTTVSTGTGYLKATNTITNYISNGLLLVRNDSYTDPTTFKQAMSGVLLYYELAEPIEVDLPEPLNMTYEAWDFGTEELVAKGATTPLNAEIVYQFNAVDRIRDNSSAIDVLEEHVEEHKNDGIKLLDNGNLKLTLKGETREFMPATPSGDPMHWAYVSAGAEYNDSGVDIVKDAPWAALADTDEEKRVTHKAGCWYLNGVGDMTNDDIRYSYTNRTLLYDLNKRACLSNNSIIRTIYSAYRGASTAGFGPTKSSALYGCNKLETFLLSDMAVIKQESDYSLSLSGAYELYNCKALKAIGQVTPTITDINKFKGCTSLRYIWIYALKVSLNLKDSSLISKLSVKYMIDNATPTSAITITLHADAYARLSDDADIVAALEAKPLVTLVSA